MNIFDPIHNLFGIYAPKLSIWHMMWRALFVYVLGILLARFNKRFMALRTVNNFFLFIFIGSILASSIVGQYFYEILGMAIFIIFINWLVVVTSFYNSKLRHIIEGKPVVLIENGKILKENLDHFFIAEEDLMTLMRIHTNTMDLSKINKAYFESNGQISFVVKQSI